MEFFFGRFNPDDIVDARIVFTLKLEQLKLFIPNVTKNIFERDNDTHYNKNTHKDKELRSKSLLAGPLKNFKVKIQAISSKMFSRNEISNMEKFPLIIQGWYAQVCCRHSPRHSQQLQIRYL